jgi:hypothetical protein
MSDTPDEQIANAPAPEVKSGRPFRVKLRGSVLALIKLPNRRQLKAAMHQLSITGGMIHLEKPLDEKLKVELIFHIDQATIRGTVEMLFPMWATQGWLQPFRFTEMDEVTRQSLEANLKSYIGQSPEVQPSAQAAAAGQ